MISGFREFGCISDGSQQIINCLERQHPFWRIKIRNREDHSCVVSMESAHVCCCSRVTWKGFTIGRPPSLLHGGSRVFKCRDPAPLTANLTPFSFRKEWVCQIFLPTFARYGLYCAVPTQYKSKVGDKSYVIESPRQCCGRQASALNARWAFQPLPDRGNAASRQPPEREPTHVLEERLAKFIIDALEKAFDSIKSPSRLLTGSEKALFGLFLEGAGPNNRDIKSDTVRRQVQTAV